MMEASKDTVSSNTLLQRCNDLQKLCETVRTERNYPKRTFDLVSSSDSFIPSTKRARSDVTETLTTTTTTTTSSEEGSALPVAVKPSMDREAFYKRLETFSAPFVSKRRPVNAVQCAMHGFIDTHVVGGPKQNICKLLCPSCQCTNFVIDISCFNPNVPKVQEIMQTYLADLSKLHRPGCFWKLDKCSDDIYAFPLRTSTEALDLISTEGARLLSCGDSLPTVEHPLTSDQLEKLDVVIRAAEKYSDYYDTPALPDSKRIPYIIALFGWRLYLQGGVHSLKCHHCFRTMRLNQTRTPQTFNVLDHMEYCPWVNRAQAMVYKPSQQPQPLVTATVAAAASHVDGQDGSSSSNQYVCGQEWMTDIIDLEYNFLFYMRETSIAYQESRLQWFKDAKRRMAKSRADLAMEFPDSPESIPDKILEVTEDTTKLSVAAEELAGVEEETRVTGDESNALLAESTEPQEEHKEESIDQLESAPTTVTKEAEEPDTAPEIEDELIDYMESEPEDEGGAEPVASPAVETEIREKDEEHDEATGATTDVEIDVSLLDDMQTPTAISTTASTPLPDQLQHANEDDVTAALTRQSPPLIKQKQVTPTLESDLEVNEEEETMASHPGSDKQQLGDDQEQDTTITTDDVFTPSGAQIEEINDLDQEMVAEEVTWPQGGDKVASLGPEKEVDLKNEEEYGQVASTVPVVIEQDSTVPEHHATDDDVDREVEDVDMVSESQQAIVTVGEPKPQEDEGAEGVVMEQEAEQTVPVVTEVVEQVSSDALMGGAGEQPQIVEAVVTKDGDVNRSSSEEMEDAQEIQGTVSVSSPKPEQDDEEYGGSDDVEAFQKEATPVADGLDGVEDDGVKQQREQQQQQQQDNDDTQDNINGIVDDFEDTNNMDGSVAVQVESSVEGGQQDDKDGIETTQQASNDDSIESAVATQENTAQLEENNDEVIAETAILTDDKVSQPEDDTAHVEENQTVTEDEQVTTDNVQTESVVVAAEEEEKGAAATTETASGEQQQFLTENIDTSVSTPQLLQAMEDALGQSPSHPVTEDTPVARQVTEIRSSEEATPAAVAAATSDSTTTATTLMFKDPEVDTMVEDEVVESSVAADADENIERNDVGAGQENSAIVDDGEAEKMQEDMIDGDGDGDVGMEEVVDEEMSNVEDGAMEEQPAATTIAAAAAAEDT